MKKRPSVVWRGVILEGFTDKEIEAYGCKKKKGGSMKLCINKECLEVAKEEWYSYCPHCGNKLFHAGTIESEEAEELIKAKIKEEMNPKNTKWYCPLHKIKYIEGVTQDGGNGMYCPNCFKRWGWDWVKELEVELIRLKIGEAKN